MNNNDAEFLRLFGMSQVEGPTLMTPPTPTPYYSCTGCKYFKKEMACSGGMTGSPTYYKYCEEPSLSDVDKWKWRLSGVYGSGEGKEITPTWCPLLPNKTVDPT